MANNYDDDVVDRNGPKGFRRLFDSIASVFRSGGSGPILQAGGPPAQDAVNKIYAVYRARNDKAGPLTKSRQQSVKDKLKVFENNIKPLVEEKLSQSFHPDNYRRMFFVIHASTNLMTRIMGDTCFLYENPARRKLMEPEKAITQTAEGALPSGTVDGPPPSEAQAPLDATPPPADATQPGGPELQTGNADVDALAEVLDLTGKPEAEDSPFDKLMKAYDWDVLLDHIERLCMICPAVWVRPYVLYELDDQGKDKLDTGRLTYIIYTPECADVVMHPDDPNTAIAWYYWGEELVMVNGEIKRQTIIHFFTATNYYRFDGEWTVKGNEPNKLARLPATKFQIGMPAKGYYCDGVGDDLFEATLELCIIKTIENSRAKDSGFKQIAVTGRQEDVPADQVMGGPIPIYLGDEGTASVLDLMPALEKFTQMWKERELSLAAKHGINAAAYKGESSPQSGFAKKLDQDKVLKESKRRRKFFAKAEQDLYTLTALELEQNPIKDIGKLDPKAQLETDFAEPTFEEDPQNQASTDALNIKMNVVSIIDILRRDNPDLSDVELVKLAQKNKRINDVFMSADQLKLIDLLAQPQGAGAAGGAPPGGKPPGAGGPPKPPGAGGGGFNGPPPGA